MAFNRYRLGAILYIVNFRSGRVAFKKGKLLQRKLGLTDDESQKLFGSYRPSKNYKS